MIHQFFTITAAIMVFAFPFLLLYKKKHNLSLIMFFKKSDEIEHFFNSREGEYLVFSWAMLEAFVWWVIPEFLLLLVIFMRSRNKVRLLVFDIAGTMIGTVIAYILAAKTASTDVHIANLPYITPIMVRQVTIWYSHLGPLGLLLQPFSGIPYKVFTLLGPRYGFNVILFLTLAVGVRMGRYYLFFTLFTGIYPFLHKIVSRNYLLLFLSACLIFSASLTRVVGIYTDSYKDYYAFQNIFLK